jgi:hypothetical protein
MRSQAVQMQARRESNRLETGFVWFVMAFAGASGAARGSDHLVASAVELNASVVRPGAGTVRAGASPVSASPRSVQGLSRRAAFDQARPQL